MGFLAHDNGSALPHPSRLSDGAKRATPWSVPPSMMWLNVPALLTTGLLWEWNMRIREEYGGPGRRVDD